MDDEDTTPVVVPMTALPPETLRALVEEFVTRDGTDYGTYERSLDDKVRDVMRQLARDDARIVYDPASQTTNIVDAKR
jgi:uncharacterized protein YheU (UPF0270 family)